MFREFLGDNELRFLKKCGAIYRAVADPIWRNADTYGGILALIARYYIK